jgi:hypothetical protein
MASAKKPFPESRKPGMEVISILVACEANIPVKLEVAIKFRKSRIDTTSPTPNSGALLSLRRELKRHKF